MKSKGTAYILWAVSVFGVLGFHRFYLGKIGTGVLWFLTGGCLLVGAFADGLTLGNQVDEVNATGFHGLRASTKVLTEVREP